MNKGTRQYRALLFDLDGTVLDTRELILASYHYACDQVLGFRLPDEPLLEMIGVPLPEQMYKLTPPKHAEAMVLAYREHNALAHNSLIEYFPGTHEALSALTSAGWPMVIVTSKRNDSALQGLKCFDLDKYFELIVGYNDTDRHKPEPDPLLFAANQLGVLPEECIYIGDSPYDMQAARAAGCLAIGAEWGFFDRDRLLEAGAEILVPEISKLAAIIEQLA
ncbi:MAG: HAD-IA family hydrolase [Coriobacteriales bacterium]|jgi:pyrophosphatase PpaX|nr:HAD-IA family hydrolase [Coriobacteriales bacterium]